MPVPSASLQPIDDKNLLVDRVEEALRDAIMSGGLPTGARLSVPELAARLNVSRTPVREALLALERAGLVETRPRRGAVVFGGGPRELQNFFELREALEGMAARLAATRMTTSEQRGLEAIAAQHASAQRDGDRARFVQHDFDFHRAVRDGAHNPRLAEDLSRLGDQILLVMRSSLSQSHRIRRATVHEHQAIARAVVDQNPDAAEHAARTHVHHAWQHVQPRLAEAHVVS